MELLKLILDQFLRFQRLILKEIIASGFSLCSFDLKTEKSTTSSSWVTFMWLKRSAEVPWILLRLSSLFCKLLRDSESSSCRLQATHRQIKNTTAVIRLHCEMMFWYPRDIYRLLLITKREQCQPQSWQTWGTAFFQYRKNPVHVPHDNLYVKNTRKHPVSLVALCSSVVVGHIIYALLSYLAVQHCFSYRGAVVGFV